MTRSMLALLVVWGAALAACADSSTTIAGSGGQNVGGDGGQQATGGGGAGGDGGSNASGGQGGNGGQGGAGGQAPTCQGLRPASGTTNHSLDWDGSTRSYSVHVPPGYTAEAALPVVFVFHGFTETASLIELISGMTPVAEARDYIVVYAEGLFTSWNAGACCGSSGTLGVDDVGFVAAMLAEIESTYCVDSSRIFASGFSNGGMLSHRLACEMSDTFAAIGAVSGTIAVADCTPSRPIPVSNFHGTADLIVPYNGGFSGGASVPDTINGWITRNGCTTTVTTFDQGDALCETHGECDAGADVMLCTLEGGGHQWPGGSSSGPNGIINMDISASSALLDFFDQHPMPAP
jgi:polyhydroxybutyrate depolymerase